MRSHDAEVGEIAKTTRAPRHHDGKALPCVRHHVRAPRLGESGHADGPAQTPIFPWSFLESAFRPTPFISNENSRTSYQGQGLGVTFQARVPLAAYGGRGNLPCDAISKV